MLYNLIFNLLVVHLICDFYLQNQTICKNKIKLSIRGYSLWMHAIIIGLLTLIAIWDINGWWLALLVSVVHFLVDWLKSVFELKCNIYIIDKKNNTIENGVNRRYGLYFFISDQIIHILFIIFVSFIWYKSNNNWSQFNWLQHLFQTHSLRVYTIIALLIIIKPINILILQILRFCKLNDGTECDNQENFHAGALIGYTERCLMLIFVIMAQYEALGFLIAAKSLLRFSEASSGNTKSEYVLAGTLLSLIFSIFIGLCVIKMSDYIFF